MKYVYLIAFAFFSVLNANSQKLTLTDLQNTCNKTNWEYVNQYLMNKDWEYYDSEKGSSTKYNTITWSYNKSYGDKAEAWFYIFTYEGFPNKINYFVFNKPSYSIIQKSLSTLGYKLTESEIKDNEIISTYTNSKFILKITTKKREKDNYYSYNEKSITAYSFLLIKKSGIYDPDNGNKIDYWYDRGLAKYHLGNYEAAIKDFDKAIALNPQFAPYYYNRGLAKGDLGYYEEAIKDFDKAIELNPQYAEAYFKRGNAKIALGNYAEAIKDYNKAIALNTQDAIAYNNRGFANARLGKYEDAITDYKKAIEMDPTLKDKDFERDLLEDLNK